jgi:MoaA/NifB/PqqE/SkfB family radical SAM enzyme
MTKSVRDEPCSCTGGIGLAAPRAAAIVSAINALTPRPLARAIFWLLLLLARGALTSARLERLWRKALLCDTGNGAAGASGAFAERFFHQLRLTRSFETLAAFIQREGRWRVACHLEAFARFAILTELRGWLLGGGAGPPPLAEVQLSTCGPCDLNCQGCYSAGEREARSCDGARVAYLVDESALQGAAAVHFLGKGEPLLDESHARALLAVAARRPHLLFTLTTNGMHLTRAVAREAARAPNVLLLLSVDGPERINDDRRGRGVFAGALAAMRLLREEGALFGFSCTVAKANANEAATPAFVAAMRAAGCCLGVYSRHFSVEASAAGPWNLPPDDVEEFLAALDAVRVDAGMPLFDLDELEAHTGCRARAGLSLYVDGLSGRVAPCIKVPHAPAECLLRGDRPGELAEILSHPFFVQYRSAQCAGGRWCGANHGAERAAVAAASTALDETTRIERDP